ncbi:Flagellar basal body-associated protein [Roseovarius mucosus DSM 17069]|uniref:Flagellar protein FliL n=1 Tax=Roseovarius mucosus DSM 17069 TaxID=1288298 RepID=A0A0A0HV73_9RHOB|nr:flagellar basal body-associated FliL family protein [Roseovarius mucosus]KGM89958.1 Flagellar basal body-associated protein [Roseovarius mucosus DSM 17069]
MPETGELETTAVARPSKKPLMIGLVLSLLGATAGFYTMWSGLIPLGGGHEPVAEAPVEGATDPGLPTVELVFVPVVPVVVSVGQGAARSHLRFAAELEVKAAHKSHVEKLMPRIVDVTNTYLRALKLADLEDAQALIRLRAQLLRRMQVVTGAGRINDLLIMEFVLN